MSAFTIDIPNNHRHAIVIEIHLEFPILANGKLATASVKTHALIDTGANGSCVSSRLASACHLNRIASVKVNSINGRIVMPVYKTDLILPNNLRFQDIPVMEFPGGSDFEVIIGMDILSKGDVAITNANNETVFSMRIPSSDEHIDFTK